MASMATSIGSDPLTSSAVRMRIVGIGTSYRRSVIVGTDGAMRSAWYLDDALDEAGTEGRHVPGSRDACSTLIPPSRSRARISARRCCLSLNVIVPMPGSMRTKSLTN